MTIRLSSRYNFFKNCHLYSLIKFRGWNILTASGLTNFCSVLEFVTKPFQPHCCLEIFKGLQLMAAGETLDAGYDRRIGSFESFDIYLNVVFIAYFFKPEWKLFFWWQRSGWSQNSGRSFTMGNRCWLFNGQKSKY